MQQRHKYLLSAAQAARITALVTNQLGDERREVAIAATAAFTGILAFMSAADVEALVAKYITIANQSAMPKKQKVIAATAGASAAAPPATGPSAVAEEARTKRQRISVSILCAAVNANPYSVPPIVPAAIAAISRHTYERAAPVGVRETAKKTLSDFKRTHVDTWQTDRTLFDDSQLECLDDVSTCSYYA